MTKTALDAQVGFADEATFGTFVAPAVFHEWVEWSVKRSDEKIESKGRRPGRRIQSANRREQGRTGASGDASFELNDRGADKLLLPCLGAVAHAQPDAPGSPTVWEHTVTLGGLDGTSFSAQVGLPDNTGAVQALSYRGGKVLSWEMSNTVDEYLMLKQSLDFVEELDNQALAVATFVDANPLSWAGAAINLDGSPIDVKSVSLQGDSGLINDRFFLGSKTKKEQLEGGALRGLSGELSGAEFSGLTDYQLFTSGAIVPLTFAWTGGVIENAFNFAVEVTLAAVQFDGDTPNPGDGVIEQPLPFTVLDPEDGSEPVSIVVRDDVAFP